MNAIGRYTGRIFVHVKLCEVLTIAINNCYNIQTISQGRKSLMRLRLTIKLLRYQNKAKCHLCINCSDERQKKYLHKI